MGGDASALAQALVSARIHHAQLRSAEWADALGDAAAAYAVQDEVARALGWFDGGAARCWKSGGPSRTAPLTHAVLAPPGVRSTPASFDDMRFHHPGIEAEVALRLARDVDANTAAGMAPEV